MRTLLASACLILTLTAAPVLAAQTFGLVIGIDDYEHIPDLDGAVNDANDIADALRGIDAEVVTLINREATRDSILSTWRELAKRMAPGDQLIVSYAGHGSNEAEHNEGNEEDGRDETFLLAGFSPYGEAARERIRDDEIAELIALAPEAKVIFLADACHSGTVSRTINPVLGYRYVSHAEITNDPLPPPPPNTPANDGEDTIEMFLAAVDEADKVPEFLIDGQARGALSFAFAEGLRGKADLDGNRSLTKGEIEQYVRRRVRGISQGIQSPQVQHSGTADDVLFALAGSGDAGHTTQALPQTPTINTATLADLVPVSLTAEPGSQALATKLVRDDPDPLVRLRVDTGTGKVRTSAGDIIANIGPASDPDFEGRLKSVVAKMRLAKVIEALSDNTGFEIKFADGDRNYVDGDTVNVQIEGRQTSYVTIFNIGSDGQIAYLYPLNIPGAGLNDPMAIAASDQLDMPLEIAAPYGADHVVAIETTHDPILLRRVLFSHDGSTNSVAFWKQLHQVLGRSADQPKIALFPFFSIAR